MLPGDVIVTGEHLRCIVKRVAPYAGRWDAKNRTVYTKCGEVLHRHISIEKSDDPANCMLCITDEPVGSSGYRRAVYEKGRQLGFSSDRVRAAASEESRRKAQEAEVARLQRVRAVAKARRARQR